MKLKKATFNDIQALQKICITSYANNFYSHWNENGLEWYLEREFGNERLKADLANRNLAYYFVKYNENPVGFVKIWYNAEFNGLQKSAAELEKIYLLPEFKGKGLGKAALGKIVENLKKKGIKTLFFVLSTPTQMPLHFIKNLVLSGKEPLGLTFRILKRS